MQYTWVPVSSVQVPDWRKRDLGDIESLTKSIEKHGLMDAIVVSKKNVLISGWRRLAAVQRLGKQSIEAYRTDDILVVAKLLAKEGRNPEHYKEMVWSEMVAFGLGLEDMDAEYNKTNLSNARRKAATTRWGGEYHAKPGKRTPTSALIAEILGTTRGLYGIARRVFVASQRFGMTQQDMSIAQTALQYMDESGQPYGALAMLKGEMRYLPRDQADRQRIQLSEVRNILDGSTSVLDGLVKGLRTVQEIPSAVTKEEATRWASDLSAARRVMEQVINKLRRFVNDG